ncbi:MAG: acyl-CoA synthetase [Gammaproteobacteria bacterium]|nr:acyl-CoA synthetase [Gammaproteobacteria bacterium]
MTYAWSYGDIIEGVETIVQPDQPVLIHGERQVNWDAFTRRTNNLARNLLASGVAQGDKIAFYMRNCSEYSESIFAGFKAGLVHVNVNYRYIDHELVYLIDNSDASVVVYGADFQHQVDEIRGQLPKVKQWLVVDDSNPDSAYEDMAERGDGSSPYVTHSPDDLLFLYTGGTTGIPKGVMWSHDDLFRVVGAGGNRWLDIPPCADLDEYLERIGNNPKPVNLPLPPLMHGTGLLAAIGAIVAGGTCVTLPTKQFEPELALENISRHKVTIATIVGDSFARPMLEALDAKPGEHDISSLDIIASSGAMWTKEVKKGLLKHNENMLLIDGFSSSEAIGLGASLMTKDETIEVASFKLGENCKVFTEDGAEVLPGSGQSGMIAVKGFLPIGYYKDQEKTDDTFKVINGVRYSIPGDWVQVEDDGTLTLLGRDSNCINTAGEKVFPEEVEEALKHHDKVDDALVIGIKDDQWGQSITAIVQPATGYEIDELGLREFSRQHLAPYKVPKRILVKDDLGRAPNGKADYASITAFAEAELGIQEQN